MSASVVTPYGEIFGIDHEDCQEFRGIPYAEQPIGVSRFKAPEPLLPFDEPFRADRFSDAAPQEIIDVFGITKTSEDCLYLNIWTPACDDKKRPVMIWFHGGAYSTGAGSQRLYNGQTLAVRGDVVVVTINFRLGVLGYLFLNDLIPESYGVSANNGLLDQLEALKWVKTNIENFGGDSNQITLFGESSGAMSIATLMATPAAQGLFNRVILQSGAADQTLTRDEATAVAKTFLEVTDVNPNQPEKLWQLTPQAIIQAQQRCLALTIERGVYSQSVPQTGMTLLPVVDGVTLPLSPAVALQKGQVAHIPMMVGCTRDEWNFFLRVPGAEKLQWRYDTKSLDKLALIQLCEQNLPGMGERAANLYEKVVKKRKPEANYCDVFSKFEGDRFFGIPSLRMAEYQSQFSDQVYFFQFNWDRGLFGACHASDIPFVFGNTETVGQFLTGGGQQASRLSTIVQSCWTAFARSSNPSTDRVGSWSPFTADSRKVMIFDETCAMEDDPFAETLPLWKGIL